LESWHIQSGTPLHILQELGGWESSEMVERYAHLSTDHLAEQADTGWLRSASLQRWHKTVTALK